MTHEWERILFAIEYEVETSRFDPKDIEWRFRGEVMRRGWRGSGVAVL